MALEQIVEERGSVVFLVLCSGMDALGHERKQRAVEAGALEVHGTYYVAIIAVLITVLRTMLGHSGA